jgi:hypothetical protein
MMIPKILYGLYKEVKPQCKKNITRLIKEKNCSSIFSGLELVNTADFKDSLIVINGPYSILGAEPHFHSYLLLDLIHQDDRIDQGFMDIIFNASLNYEWGVLGLMGTKNNFWLWNLDESISKEEWENRKAKPFLSACLRYWDVIYGEGERYTPGVKYTENAWEMNSSMTYVLANMGVPHKVFDSPLPPGGLAEVIAMTGLKI